MKKSKEAPSPFQRHKIEPDEDRKVRVYLRAASRYPLATESAKFEVEKFMLAEGRQFRGVDPTGTSIYPITDKGVPLDDPHSQSPVGFEAEFLAYA